jgi:hypothetical protein
MQFIARHDTGRYTEHGFFINRQFEPHAQSKIGEFT